MTRYLVRWGGVFALWWLLVASVAAHGGNYIINEARGRYFVVASLSPAPMSVGRGDLSVAVRDSTSYAPLPVEQILVRLVPVNGATTEYNAAPEGASSDAIYGLHTLNFADSGDWQVVVTVIDAGTRLEFSSTVAVAGGAWRWFNTIIYLLPLLVLLLLVGLAALRNHKLRQINPPMEATSES